MSEYLAVYIENVSQSIQSDTMFIVSAVKDLFTWITIKTTVFEYYTYENIQQHLSYDLPSGRRKDRRTVVQRE